MTDVDARKEMVRLWLDKSDNALDSARLELERNHTEFAVNRLYYCCFYAVTALLLQDRKQFARHSAVKSEFMRSYVKPGDIDVKWSRFYQRLFDDRHQADYLPTMPFDAEDVGARIQQAAEFVSLVRQLIRRRTI